MRVRLLSPVLLLIIIVVCIAITMFKTRELKEFAEKSTAVVVSKENILSGTVINEKMVKRKRVLNDKIKEAVVIKLESALGATTTRDIKAGEQICKEDLEAVQSADPKGGEELTKKEEGKEETETATK